MRGWVQGGVGWGSVVGDEVSCGARFKVRVAVDVEVKVEVVMRVVEVGEVGDGCLVC